MFILYSRIALFFTRHKPPSYTSLLSTFSPCICSFLHSFTVISIFHYKTHTSIIYLTFLNAFLPRNYFFLHVTILYRFIFQHKTHNSTIYFTIANLFSSSLLLLHFIILSVFSTMIYLSIIYCTVFRVILLLFTTFAFHNLVSLCFPSQAIHSHHFTLKQTLYYFHICSLDSIHSRHHSLAHTCIASFTNPLTRLM